MRHGASLVVRMFTGGVLLRRVDRLEIGAQGISQLITEMEITRRLLVTWARGGSVAGDGEKPDWRVFNQNVTCGGKRVIPLLHFEKENTDGYHRREPGHLWLRGGSGFSFVYLWFLIIPLQTC